MVGRGDLRIRSREGERIRRKAVHRAAGRSNPSFGFVPPPDAAQGRKDGQRPCVRRFRGRRRFQSGKSLKSTDYAPPICIGAELERPARAREGLGQTLRSPVWERRLGSEPSPACGPERLWVPRDDGPCGGRRLAPQSVGGRILDRRSAVRTMAVPAMPRHGHAMACPTSSTGKMPVARVRGRIPAPSLQSLAPSPQSLAPSPFTPSTA